MDKGEKLIKKPVYPGGSKAIAAFIKEHMVYPEKAMANKTQGTVSVVIDIDGDGHVMRARVKKSLGHGCDEEAMRLCKLLKFRTAAKRKNRRITFHRTINIHFRLPKPMKKAPVKKKEAPTPPVSATGGSMKIVYSYVPKKK